MSNKGINLLIDSRKFKSLSPKKGRLMILRYSSMAILFIVGLTSVILSILIVFSPLPQLQEDEQKARKGLAAYRIDINKLGFINERGDNIRQILKNRPDYSKKLDVLQSKLPRDVTMDELTLTKKTYTLKFSSNNLASLDELINSMLALTGKDREFLRIYLTSLSIDGDKNRFNLTVDLLAA